MEAAVKLKSLLYFKKKHRNRSECPNYQSKIYGTMETSIQILFWIQLQI